jgi:hypothetical protein
MEERTSHPTEDKKMMESEPISRRRVRPMDKDLYISR